jgi:hypothetical protein
MIRSLFEAARILIGGVIGSAVWLMLYGTLLPIWAILPIGQAPNSATDIQSITYQYDGIGHLEENIVYLRTQSGELYSFYQNKWKLLPDRTQKSDDIPPIACANEWHLPIFGVADSSGVVYEHALADEYICYILFKDGRLQVWDRTIDAMNLLFFMAVSAFIGMFAGARITVILKYFKDKMSKQKVAQSSNV